MSGPCAKRHVECWIRTADNSSVFYGSNECEHPQAACPRLPGEGYSKCKTICGQTAHAEVMALRAAAKACVSVAGGTASIIGHYRLCDDCAAAMKMMGIAFVTLPDA